MKSQFKTEPKVFGDNNALDGYAGFRCHQTCTVRYRTEEDGTVKLTLDHVGQPERKVTFSGV